MGKPQSTGNLVNALAQDSSNNIGIGGAANASFKLQVTGATNLTGALSGTSATFSGSGLFGGSTNAGNAGTFTLSVGIPGTTAGGLQLWAATNQSSFLQFGDSTTAADNYRGYVGYNHATDTLSLGAAGADRLTIASTGAATFNISSGGYNATFNGPSYGGLILSNGGTANTYFVGESSLLSIEHTTAINLRTNNENRVRITSGGNVGIGTSSPTSYGGFTTLNINNATNGGLIDLLNNGTRVGTFFNTSSDVNIGSITSVPFIFYTANTERMRITSGGFLKAKGSDSTYFTTNNVHELRTGVGNDYTTIISSTAGSPYGVYIAYPNANPNGSVNEFFICADNIATRVVIRSNGGIANYQANDVNLSDERTKKDIIPLESYWNKFKAIEIVKFKYKDQTHDDFNIGVIAQQVEAVAPEFVDIDGWDKPQLDEEGNDIKSNKEPLKAIYTADLHHATIKVLQEAMAKIEEQQAQIEELKAIVATK